MFNSFLLGIIQGIAEWLPISSSGHLVLLQKFLKLQEDITFDIFLHLSSLIVVFIFFWEDIFQVSKAFFTFKKKTYEFKISIYVILSSIITGIIGIFLKKKEYILTNTNILCFSFLFTAIILFFSKKETNKKLDWKKSLFIGLMQGIALFPGISRAGATIAGAKIVGVKNEEAFKFSFLIFIPAVIGALFMEFKEIRFINFNFLFIGFFTSLIVSCISITFLKNFVIKNKLHYFGYYCLFLSILTFIFFDIHLIK